jgi:hypothetical protein
MQLILFVNLLRPISIPLIWKFNAAFYQFLNLAGVLPRGYRHHHHRRRRRRRRRRRLPPLSL